MYALFTYLKILKMSFIVLFIRLKIITVYILFTYYVCTVYIFKNIKNEFYRTIHTFKNYFTTVFSIFSF